MMDQELMLETLDDSQPLDANAKTMMQKYAKYLPTISAAALAIISAAFVPAMVLYLAVEIGTPFERVSLPGAICRSLILVLPLLYCMLVIHKSLLHRGLAESYLHWNSDLCRALTETTGKVAWVCIPLIAVETALEWFEVGRWNDSLGRVFFIANLSVLTVALARSGSQLVAYSKSLGCSANRCLSIQSLRWLVVAMPLSLIVMSVAGYQFTAVQLSWRLFWTLVIGLGIALLTGLAYQLTLIAQFRIKLRQLEQEHDGDFDPEDSIDISEISSQVARLLKTIAAVTALVIGWQIWANVLPVISYLDEVHLWPAANSLVENSVKQFVSLRHLFMALGIVAVTFVLSRNLPGLLEIVLLERLPLDRGGRYAISFVLRYLVSIAGLLLACKLLGFAWSSVQWLAAGLTVGLGFGLQEIFANLVSGIIILIERPVRVGDFVTVRGVTGTVLRMELRATTIRDLDHREWIVPNKKFITDDVMNWTLSDSITRLVFTVGIAYGSDTQLAQSTLLKVARANPNVLNEPEPQVIFSSFGDSSLCFELKVMIPHRDLYFQVMHELNMAIDQALKAENIEIAFPQSEVRIHGLDTIAKGTSPGATPAEQPDTVVVKKAG